MSKQNQTSNVNHQSGNTQSRKIQSGKMQSGKAQSGKVQSGKVRSQKTQPGRTKSAQTKSTRAQMGKSRHLMLPIVFVLCIIPLIVRVKQYNPELSSFVWFPNIESHWDFFLYYKQYAVIAVGALMAIMIGWRLYNGRKEVILRPIMLPLILYMILCIISTLFSDNLSYSLSGGFEQFESVFALLGYGMITYYGMLFIKSENDIRFIVSFFRISVIIMVILGVFQFIGKDFFATEMGKIFIVPSDIRRKYKLNFSFPEKTVYLSLYNPNLVGSYIALCFPLLLVTLFFIKEKRMIILQSLLVIGLAICLIGSGSDAGIIALIIVLILVPIFMWRTLLKRWYVILPSILLLACTFMFINGKTSGSIVNKFNAGLKLETTEFNITNMRTEDNFISFRYKGNIMQVGYSIGKDLIGAFTPIDETGSPIEFELDSATGAYLSKDDRFSEIILVADKTKAGIFHIIIDKEQWSFFLDSKDMTYYYINQHGKPDKIKEAPSSLFTGYEGFATERGYLWSRTIPLLKDYIVLGSGPDTFAMAFPQNDYMNLRLNKFEGGILTKPHNMYLQIGVQTGVLSLIAFLIFYLMYFISSLSLYITGIFNSYYAQVGFGIFISTFAYMITGLANDSSIATAPIFWAFMGIGITLNHIAKPYILQERQRMKEVKQN